MKISDCPYKPGTPEHLVWLTQFRPDPEDVEANRKIAGVERFGGQLIHGHRHGIMTDDGPLFAAEQGYPEACYPFLRYRVGFTELDRPRQDLPTREELLLRIEKSLDIPGE